MGKGSTDNLGMVDTVGSNENLVAVDTPDNQDNHKVQFVQDTLDRLDVPDYHTLIVADNHIAYKVLVAPVVVVDLAAHRMGTDCHCRSLEVEPVVALAQQVGQ